MSKITTFPKYDVVIDWLEFTIKNKSIYEILFDWGFDKNKLHMFSSGFLHYDVTFVYGEKIKFLLRSTDIYHMYYDPELDTEKNKEIWENREVENCMGVHVLLSGYACREIEGKIRWSDLLWYVWNHSKNVSRIDIAFDVFDKNILSLEKVRWYLKNGLMVSKARYSIETLKRDNTTGDICGQSVRIGSSASETMVMIYDKLQERESANYLIDKDIKAWNRLELRLRKDTAFNLLDTWQKTGKDPIELSIFVLNNVLGFKDKDDKDSNKSRKRNAKWWDDFIGTTEKLRLSEKSIQSSIQRKKTWIEETTLKSLAMVFVADLDDINLTDPHKFILDGIYKINSYNLEMINNYRLERGASVLFESDLDLIRTKIQLDKDIFDNCQTKV